MLVCCGTALSGLDLWFAALRHTDYATVYRLAALQTGSFFTRHLSHLLFIGEGLSLVAEIAVYTRPYPVAFRI